MRCKSVANNEIRVSKMKDGDIGKLCGPYDEEIVQAHGNNLVSLGKNSGDSWIDRRDKLILYVQILILPFTLEFTED